MLRKASTAPAGGWLVTSGDISPTLDGHARLIRMKYEVDFPPEVDQRLTAQASATGQDVVHLIQIAVVRFMGDEVGSSMPSAWLPEQQDRRCLLIDRDIAGSITAAELVELAELDRRANEHFDEIAPPPLDGARRLHQKLLQSRGHQ